MKELITITEAASRANVNDKTLRRAIDAGNLAVQPRTYRNQPVMIAVQDLESYIASRQPTQLVSVNADLATRLAEVEQTLARTQEAQLLGVGRDLLALGPADDAYTQNRIDSLEQRITELEKEQEVNIRLINEWIAKSEKRITELEDALAAEQAYSYPLQIRITSLENAVYKAKPNQQ
jgi:hypothetical protein